jgi:outer membrane protein OmpA-like peptidoglycan-associated protein
MNKTKMIGAFLTACGILLAQAPQAPNPTQQLASNENEARTAAGSAPIYRITVVGRTTRAINYSHRGGATKIDFAGTTLLPGAHGEAKVESKQGYIEIEVEFRGLQAATAYGPEFLTYVMWSITPEGRTANLGEVLLNGTNAKLNVTTELQSFGLIVTAEPYFGVTQPSDVVVMENVIRSDTQGRVEAVDAKYELLQRGQYTLNVNPAEIRPVRLDRKTPLELYEARNAVQIARWTGAQRYAPETYQKAVQGLANAEGYLKSKAGRKQVVTAAREAVQMAEDARIITVKRIREEQLANERQAAAERQARTESERAAAQSETERVAREAERARIAAQADAERVRQDNDARAAAAQNEADRLRRENDARMASAQTEADRLKRENEAQAATAQSEADRLRRENDARMASAQTEADRLRRESEAQAAAAQNEVDRLRREGEAQRAAAQADIDRAVREKAQAEAEKAELRAQLLKQFNAILQTRDTARGLVVNMSDVLFDTAKYSLRPLAREKLAKVAGILLGHPALRLEVEGHTDSVGSDDYNQRLSEQRGGAVRDYLAQQGMPATSITVKGLGETQPVASNDSSKGRQQNRRVELVVSGDIIGQ